MKVTMKSIYIIFFISGAAHLKTKYTDVNCCTEDNCNSAPHTVTNSYLTMGIVPLVYAVIQAFFNNGL